MYSDKLMRVRTGCRLVAPGAAVAAAHRAAPARRRRDHRQGLHQPARHAGPAGRPRRRAVRRAERRPPQERDQFGQPVDDEVGPVLGRDRFCPPYNFQETPNRATSGRRRRTRRRRRRPQWTPSGLRSSAGVHGQDLGHPGTVSTVGDAAVFFDVDGTLVPRITSGQHLAEILGQADVGREVEASYAAGTLTSRDAAVVYARAWTGRQLAEVPGFLASLPLVDGIAETVDWCRRHCCASNGASACWTRPRCARCRSWSPPAGRAPCGWWPGTRTSGTPFADGDALGEKSALLDRSCRELGRDPAEIERSTFVDGDPWLVGPELRARRRPVHGDHPRAGLRPGAVAQVAGLA